jgi:hypothetical protein
MKRISHLLLSATFLLGITKTNIAQTVTINTDKDTYTITGAYNFIITKTDNKTQKVVYKAETKIPDKGQKEMFYPGGNNASFELVGDNIVIVYDVWQKETGTKDCSVKLMSTKTGKFNTPKLLYSTKINSVYSSHEIVYKPFYSPDKTKLAVLKDNISPSYNIDPELNIYDTKTFSVQSAKKISGKYDGQKRIFDLAKLTMDNNGDIAGGFSLMNEQTKMTTKSYSATIPFKETDFKDIKELAGGTSSDGGGSQNSHGHFYKTLEDYVNDKPIPSVRIKNGSFSWNVIRGTDFKLIDDDGNLKKESTKDLPSDIFTYKRDNFSDFFVMRLIDKKPYIILVAGKLSFYSLYEDNAKLYYTEGWDGKLESFREKDLEGYLEKYGLLEEYKKDKPKREFKDDVNGYFNKTVAWRMKYFELLNKKM